VRDRTAAQLATLTRGRTTARVMALLTSTPGQSFHTREIVRRIEGTEHPVHRALTLLAEQGLVDSHRVGNLRMWSMPTTHPLYRGLREVFARTAGIAEQIRGLFQDQPVELAFIFGSYAAGNDDATSDIDLFVLGTADWRVLTRARSDSLSKLGRELNEVIYTPDELRRSIAGGSPFIETLRDEPKLWVIGDDAELDARIRELGGTTRGRARTGLTSTATRAAKAAPRTAEPRARSREPRPR
jgi:predicted nucleotidyltransferase